MDDFRTLDAIDVSTGVIETAAAANPTVRYREYDGRTLPYPDEAFDVAFAICVVHHVPPAEWEPFAAELRRVVRPGGLALVFEHNPVNPLTRLAVYRCAFDEDVVLLGKRKTERLLAEAGLDVEESRYIVFFPWRAGWLRAVERRLGPLPLGAQYYVAARRRALGSPR